MPVKRKKGLGPRKTSYFSTHHDLY